MPVMERIWIYQPAHYIQWNKSLLRVLKELAGQKFITFFKVSEGRLIINEGNQKRGKYVFI